MTCAAWSLKLAPAQSGSAEYRTIRAESELAEIDSLELHRLHRLNTRQEYRPASTPEHALRTRLFPERPCIQVVLRHGRTCLDASP